jgi:hypothetical protein
MGSARWVWQSIYWFRTCGPRQKAERIRLFNPLREGGVVLVIFNCQIICKTSKAFSHAAHLCQEMFRALSYNIYVRIKDVGWATRCMLKDPVARISILDLFLIYISSREDSRQKNRKTLEPWVPTLSSHRSICSGVKSRYLRHRTNFAFLQLTRNCICYLVQFGLRGVVRKVR